MTVDRQTISAAADRIAPYIRRTPTLELEAADLVHPATLKLELLQHTGSFKVRGAFNSLIGLDPSGPGVAAASGGNHGAAIAYAAQALGHRARIFVPEIAAPAKVARIASYGAEIVQRGSNYGEALALCQAYISESGAVGIHAYDAEPTLSGQGTVGREFADQAPDLDTVIVAVGGGGLIGGIAAWYGSSARVVGVETLGCDTLHASMQAGRRVQVVPSGIAADSLGASMVGELMFDIAQNNIEEVVLVSDDAVQTAQRALWEQARIVAEPGGAAAFASLISGAYRPRKEERVGVLVCGGNTAPDAFASLFR